MKVHRPDAPRPRIGIVCGPLHPVYGGPASVVWSHFKALQGYADVTIFGVVSDDQRPEVEELYPGARLARRSWPNAWFRGDSLYSLIMSHARDIDVFHAHMLWDHPVYATWRVCDGMSKPFVLTPHGTLSEPWRYSSPHKRLYKYLFANKIMASAFAVQALNDHEAAAIHCACADVRVVVIPNGIEAREYGTLGIRGMNREIYDGINGNSRLFVYMGRLWRDKGLDILPKAWHLAASGRNDAVLLIVGPDYNGYKTELVQEIENLALLESVKVLPPVRGLDKLALLDAASAFVLPSKSEGFSMSLLEAAASGKPCIFSPECNFPELASNGGGFEVPRTVKDFAQALRRVMEMDSDELQAIGSKAEKFVTERYSLSVVRDKLLACYKAAMEHS